MGCSTLVFDIQATGVSGATWPMAARIAWLVTNIETLYHGPLHSLLGEHIGGRVRVFWQ